MLSKKENIDQSKIRNIGIIAHVDAGKTTTTERILYWTKAIRKMGEVDAGSTTMDRLKQERERGITIVLATIQCNWRDKTINIIDTPGHVDFSVEVSRSLRIIDSVVAVFDSVKGVESQSSTVWRFANNYNNARMCYVNKMDRIGASFEHAFGTIKSKLSPHAIAYQFPVFHGDKFVGVFDLIEQKAHYWITENKEDTSFETLDFEGAVSHFGPQIRESFNYYYPALLEGLSNHDDFVLERFLTNQHIEKEYIKSVTASLVKQRRIFPVLCGSSYKNKGVPQLLDAITEYFPSPLEIEHIRGTEISTGKEVTLRAQDKDVVIFIFKTINDSFLGEISFARIFAGSLNTGDTLRNVRNGERERVSKIIKFRSDEKLTMDNAVAGDIVGLPLKNAQTADVLCSEGGRMFRLDGIEVPKPVVDVSITPVTNEDKNKLSQALRSMAKEDPALKIHYDEETKSTILSGVGELHLEVVIDRLREEKGVNVVKSQPKVSYRETVSGSVELEQKLKKQTGGQGSFAIVKVRVEAADLGEYEDIDSRQLIFVNEVRSGNIPPEFIEPVRMGLLEGLKSGPLTRSKVVGVKVTLLDGVTHPVDSTSKSFEVVAREAITEALKMLKLILLEPIVKIDLTIPEEYYNKVLKDLAGRGGNIINSENVDGYRVVEGDMPLRKIFGYTNVLRSNTKGEVSFLYQFKNWRPCSLEEVGVTAKK